MYTRCSILPYTENGLYCFGIDSIYKTLIDFGGAIKEDETHIQCAIREADEESFGILSGLKENKFGPVIKVDECYMYPIKIKCDPELICEKFNIIYEFEVMPEMSAMIWLTKSQIVDLIKDDISKINIVDNPRESGKVYYKTRDLLIDYFDVNLEADSDTEEKPEKEEKEEKEEPISPIKLNKKISIVKKGKK